MVKCISAKLQQQNQTVNAQQKQSAHYGSHHIFAWAPTQHKRVQLSMVLRSKLCSLVKKHKTREQSETRNMRMQQKSIVLLARVEDWTRQNRRKKKDNRWCAYWSKKYLRKRYLRYVFAACLQTKALNIISSRVCSSQQKENKPITPIHEKDENGCVRFSTWMVRHWNQQGCDKPTAVSV